MDIMERIRERICLDEESYDRRSEMHGEEAPSGQKFYYGKCKEHFLTDEPFIYNSRKE